IPSSALWSWARTGAGATWTRPLCSSARPSNIVSMEIPAEAPTLASTYESRQEQRFPKLDERQLALLAQYGVQRSYAARATLFSTGDRHIPIFVVLKRGVDIVEHTPCGEEQLIVTLGPGNF